MSPLKLFIEETHRRAAAAEYIPPIGQFADSISRYFMTELRRTWSLFYLFSFALYLNIKISPGHVDSLGFQDGILTLHFYFFPIR